MYTLHQLYQSLETKRRHLLEHFKEVDENHLYYVAKPNTWSPEMLFRHFLASLYFLSKYLPGEPIELHELAIRGEPLEENNECLQREVPLNEIIDALHETSAIISERLKELTPEAEEELIDIQNRKHPRQHLILMLLEHDHAHLGQIMWLLKRSTENQRLV